MNEQQKQRLAEIQKCLNHPGYNHPSLWVHLKWIIPLLGQAQRDTERVDWLEAQSDGSSCVARQSNHGRGFRLHNTGDDSSGWHLARGSFRAAIDAAMNQAIDQAALARGEGTKI